MPVTPPAIAARDAAVVRSPDSPIAEVPDAALGSYCWQGDRVDTAVTVVDDAGVCRDRPTRDEVVATMRVATELLQCCVRSSGTLYAQIDIHLRSGAITGVLIENAATPAEAECAAAAVQSLRFPGYCGDGNFEIRYPFRVDARAAREPPNPSPSDAGDALDRGTLRIQSRPAGDVYVDDELVGQTPILGLDLPVGRYTLTIRNDILNLQRVLQVEVTAGQVLTLVVALSD